MQNPSFQAAVTVQVRALRREIGANIYAVRRGRRMTLEKLGRLSGVSPRLIDRLELGKGEFDLHCLARLCAALRVDIRDVMCVG